MNSVTAFCLVSGDRVYTGDPGVNEVEPVFSDRLADARFYSTYDEAEIILNGLGDLGHSAFIEVVNLKVINLEAEVSE